LIDVTRLDLITAPVKWVSSLGPNWLTVCAVAATIAILLGMFVGLVAEMMVVQMELSIYERLRNDYFDSNDDLE
jgi:hypothetical protein